jgi:putative toxin-antitoxin system antitoxin component (TIGR02293 family)
MAKIKAKGEDTEIKGYKHTEEPYESVQEPAAHYINTSTATLAPRLKPVYGKGNPSFYKKGKYNLEEVNNLAVADKIGLIKTGFSKDQLEEIKEESDLDYDTLSSVLSVSRAKLINKKGSEKFDQLTSERIMLLADLISYGQTVFEDKDRFNLWMKKPSKALGDKTPLELMDTVYGIDEIRKELGRIEYGVY